MGVESALAHAYLDGKIGVEIGGAAHNPFNIPNCRNIDYTASITEFKKEEIKKCNKYLKVDIVSLGEYLPFKDNSLDFILSSHVIEHFKDPIGVLKHWINIIKPNGYIFAIIPHKDRTFDKQRPCSTLAELIERHKNPTTIDLLYGRSLQGHYNVWRTQDFLTLCDYMELNVAYSLDRDDKVGNGFLVIIKK